MLQAIGIAPHADDVYWLRTALAKDRWAAGNPAEALTQFRLAREEAEATKVRGAAGVIDQLIDLLQRDPERTTAGPRWHAVRCAVDLTTTSPAAASARYFGDKVTPAVLGQSSPLPTTASALSDELEQIGLLTLRCRLPPGALEHALAHGALVFMEEETATGSTLSLISAFEELTELALVHTREWCGAALVPGWRLSERSGVHQLGALLVLGKGEDGARRKHQLLAAGIDESAELRALDQGAREANNLALVESLAVSYPAAEVAQYRYGRLLADGIVQGRIQPQQLYHWYARARERFPEAEWPAQLYAEILSHEGRIQEAGIAWSVAYDVDPFDCRNAHGIGEVYLHLPDRTEDAVHWLHRAVQLEPRNAKSHLTLARATLDDKGENLECPISARVALELDPALDGAAEALGCLAQRQGERESARKWYEQAATINPSAREHVRRLAGLNAALGRWDEARAVLHGALARADDLSLRNQAAYLAWCGGDGGAAWRLCHEDGLPVDAEMIDHAVMIARSTFEGSQGDQALESLETRLLDDFDLSPILVGRLSAWLADDRAIAYAERCVRHRDGDLSARWWLGRELLRCRRAPVRAGSLLDQVATGAPRFSAGRAAHAIALLEQDPKLAAHIEPVNDGDHLPILWLVQALACQATGDVDRAASIRDRLRELAAGLVCENASILLSWRRVELAYELLTSVGAGQTPHHALRSQWAFVLYKRGNYDRALEATGAKALLERSFDVDWSMDATATRSAIALGAYDLARDLAARRLDAIERDRIRGWDPWTLIAQLAAVNLALGTTAVRERLLHEAGQHPAALSLLVTLEKRLGLDPYEEDRRRLLQIAPGAAQVLDQHGLALEELR
jgi:tetratricopeptide (TPR) repeat protein